MSVLINMEMPTSCDDCILNNGITCYAVPDYREDGVVGRTDDRPNWCPLVEIPPHGPLIDAKGEMSVIVTIMPGGDSRIDICAPTIIPAEEG